MPPLMSLSQETVGMPLGDRIVVDPEVLAGKPVIRGTRLAVEFWNSWPQASQRTTS